MLTQALATISTTNATLAQEDTGKTNDEERSIVVVSMFLIFYSIVVLMAFIGNILVLLAVYKYTYMRTVVNLFLANLAGSDLLFALVSVFDTVAFMLSGWHAGEASCKIQSYLIEVFYTCSILTLVAVSCERYLAICRPHLKSRSIKTTFIVIAVLWITSAGFCAVLLHAYRINIVNDVPICDNLNWSHKSRRVFYTIHSVVVYLVPLSIMIWAHHKISLVIASHRVPSARPGPSQSEESEANQNEGEEKHVELKKRHESGGTVKDKRISKRKASGKYKHMRGRRRVIKILVTVTITFFALWTPFIVIRMIMYYDLQVNIYLWKATQLLILSSTAVNGLIYALMSPQFKRCFKQLLPCFHGNAKDGESTPSRGREVNSTSNSVTINRTETWKTRSFSRSLHLPKSCM